VTTSSGTSIRTQVRLIGGLPVRFARRGVNVDDAWCEALFASALQRSAAPAAESVAAAISRAVRRSGTRGCASEGIARTCDAEGAAGDAR
jgi:hypothetical protein